MRNTHGFHLKSDNTVSLLALGIVIFQYNVDVIEDKRFLSILFVVSNGETPRVVGQYLARSGRANSGAWHVIDDPVVVIAVLDVRRQGVRLDFA